ncbi:hypothetical protein SprV_0100083000 [Sparganum proliferum]
MLATYPNPAVDGEAILRIFSANALLQPPYTITLPVDHHPVKFEIDTGSAVTLINEASLQKIPSLLPASSTFRIYTGQNVEGRGVFTAEVEHDGELHYLPVHVMRGSQQPNLLGQDWIKYVPSVLSYVHQDLFRDDSATHYRGPPVKFQFQSDFRPRFFKARTVPYAVAPKVEEELDRLQKANSIEPVQYSEWAAPIVPVLKSDGSVRICGDYKLTINSATKLNPYPPPRIEDLLDNLSAEERTKIGEVIRSQGDNSTAWMYEQPKKNAEDFLLGKAVKSLEELAEISRDEAEETPAQRLARLDMQAKYREDPLNLMRQHELDKRNALLQNTAKMKKLQRLIEKQKRQQKKRDHRRNRKNKSKHSARHHHRESNGDSRSSSASSDSEDDAILDKFISLIQQQEPGVDSSGLDSLQRHMEKKNEERSSKKKKKKKSKEHVTKKKHKHKHHDREKHSHNRSQSPKVKEEEKKILRPDSPARRSSPPPPPFHRLPPSTTKRRPSPAPRRSREEMAALRAQMAADAKERERERVERYQRHQTEAKQQEDSELASRNTHGASFLKGLTLAHVATSSVEEGVQRKANSRQRGGMEENFLRH